jgi:hypothetical protein
VSDDLCVLLAVGTRLAHDGRWWQVSERDGPHVLLADPSTRLLDAPGDPVEGAGQMLNYPAWPYRSAAQLPRKRQVTVLK